MRGSQVETARLPRSPSIRANVLNKEESVNHLRPLFHGITLAALLLPVAFGTQANAEEGGHLTLQDLLAVEPIGESALSPDGKTIALTRYEQIVLFSAQGGWPVPLTSTQGSKTGLAWAPDGKRIAYAGQGSIWLFPPQADPPVGSPTPLQAAAIHARQQIAHRAGRLMADGSSSRAAGAASIASSS